MGKKEEDKPFKCRCSLRCGGPVLSVLGALDVYAKTLVAQRTDFAAYNQLCVQATHHPIDSPERRKLEGRAGAMSQGRGLHADRLQHAREALDDAIIAEAASPRAAEVA